MNEQRTLGSLPALACLDRQQTTLADRTIPGAQADEILKGSHVFQVPESSVRCGPMPAVEAAQADRKRSFANFFKLDSKKINKIQALSAPDNLAEPSPFAGLSIEYQLPSSMQDAWADL